MSEYPANKGPYHEAYLEARCYRKPYRPSRGGPLAPTASAWEQHTVLSRICYFNRDNWKIEGTHPAVETALKKFGMPKHLASMVLEQPQLATDRVRVAYVRNEAKRTAHYNEPDENKHLTATSVAKYLTRHWPHIKSDEIRNVAGMHTAHYSILTNLDDMVDAVQNCTAYTCMKDDDFDEDRCDAHPYRVYDPKYGWKLAIIKNDNGDITGRALLLDFKDRKIFVRTYGVADSNGMTQSDPGLHAWLEMQGYTYQTYWPEGCKFAKISSSSGDHLAPYLDPGAATIAHGDARNVRDCGTYLERDDSGDYKWDNTDGTPDQTEDNSVYCEDCDTSVDPDDVTYTGRYEDHCVCERCLDRNYTYAIGRGGDSYYVDDNDAVNVSGQAYDNDYLSDNNINTLHDGDYAHDDDCVYVESEQEYYHVDDIASKESSLGTVVYIEEDSEYELRENAKWCTWRKEWIKESYAIEVADGDHVHEDDYDDFLLSLDREEVEANVLDEEKLEEKLALWDEEHAMETAQMVLLPEVETVNT